MPSTTSSAFFRPQKGQNIGPNQPAPPPVPVEDTEDVVKEDTGEMVTISKAEYESLLEDSKKLQELQSVLLNK